MNASIFLQLQARMTSYMVHWRCGFG